MKYLIFILIWLIKGFFPMFWGIPTAVIYAQAKHETGNFTSPIFLESNNLFGMKQPSQRRTKALGTSRGHATFKNWFTSIYDYFLRQKYFKISGKNTNAFIQDTVNSGYAEDKAYIHKWQALVKSLQNPVLFLIPAALLGAVLLAGLWLYNKIFKS